MLTRSDAVNAPFYDRYRLLAADTDVYSAIAANTGEAIAFWEQLPAEKWHYAYATGKWTTAQVLQHIIDAERVFMYRALSFARMDASPLPGFDENDWANTVNKTVRDPSILLDEFKALRAASEAFFRQQTREELMAIGTAGNNAFNVLALGYIMAGHVVHHLRVIKERYM